MTDLELDVDTRSILNANGFDRIPFAQLQERLKKEGFNPDASRTTSNIQHPPQDELLTCPAPGSRMEEYRAMGQRAIAAGEVAVVILNGGMATRFGGVPKGVVPVLNNRSFLDYKLSQVRVAGEGRTTAVLMNSFATAAVTKQHVDNLTLDLDIRSFNQFVSLRMTPGGDVFRTADGKPSLYAPGHGDFPFALAASGILDDLMKQGVRYVTLSNVDNLGAGLDPVIIGMHVKSGRPMSVELVAANPGDVGGFPALVDGKIVIMEAFRLPADFDTGTISVFNTNTFIFDAAALKAAPDLTWFSVKKKVGDAQAVQWERLVGQMTEFVDVTWLVVSRSGETSRFIPIKTVEDITLHREALSCRLSALGVL